MTTYVIGDVQGCFAELKYLLTEIHFKADNDTLWFTGDLVNRGPQSLEVLRYVKSLGEKHITVLGNHDLHLLAVAYGVRSVNPEDTLNEILNAEDKKDLIDWLRHRPLIHVDRHTGFVLAHAGLAPQWSLEKSRQLAREVETVLHELPEYLLDHMYGSEPDQWDDELSGVERLRCIINYFTRMRYCYSDGRLDLEYKGTIEDKPDYLMPWFDVPDRVNSQDKIIFGHWAALGGKADVPNVYPMDTGCVWGKSLTAMRLEDGQRFSIGC